MIPIELWLSDEMAKRRQNATAKAVRENLTVEHLGSGDGRNYYAAGKYHVATLKDADDRMYIECSCPAAAPPNDETTGLPKYEPTCCYHAAAVLLFIAESEKETNDDK